MAITVQSKIADPLKDTGAHVWETVSCGENPKIQSVAADRLEEH